MTFATNNTIRALLVSALLTASFFVLSVPQAQAAGLTESQIQAILNLLSSFEASPSVIAATEAALRGGTTPPHDLGALTVSTDASTPAFRLVAAGSSDVSIGSYRFSAGEEAQTLNKIGVRLTSGRPNDVLTIRFYKRGGELIGSTIFSGDSEHAVSQLAVPTEIPANSYIVVDVRADLSSVGAGQAGTPGAMIKIDFNSAQSTGRTSGSAINATGYTAVAGVGVFKAYPVVAQIVTSNTLVGGSNTALQFKITASPEGPVSLGKMTVKSTALGATIQSVDLYAYTDSALSTPISNSPHLGGSSEIISGGSLNIVFNAPVVIPAGQTRYFVVRTGVVLTGQHASLATQLLGDTVGSAGLQVGTTLMQKDVAFVWSPNTYTISEFTTADWTNGYGVSGLPPTGLVHSLGGSATSTPPPPPRPVPVITFFTASPTSVVSGQTSTLNWYVEKATRCALRSSDGVEYKEIGTFGGKLVTPKQATTYTLWCANEDGSGKDGPSAEKSLTIAIRAPAPVCPSTNVAMPAPGPDLVASAASISKGCSVGIAWNGGPAAYQCYVYMTNATRNEYLVWTGVQGSSVMETVTSPTSITLRCLDTSGGYIYATPRTIQINVLDAQSALPRQSVLAEALRPRNLVAAAGAVLAAPADVLINVLTELFVSLGVGR